MAVKKDENETPVFPGGIPLQVALWTAQRAVINFNATTQRIALPTGSEIVELTATENCFVAFGGSSVDAEASIVSDASRLYLSGVQAIVVPVDSNSVPFTYIAAIQQATAGILQIEQLG